MPRHADGAVPRKMIRPDAILFSHHADAVPGTPQPRGTGCWCGPAVSQGRLTLPPARVRDAKTNRPDAMPFNVRPAHTVRLHADGPSATPPPHGEDSRGAAAIPRVTLKPPARPDQRRRCAPPERNAVQRESDALRPTTANANPQNAMPCNVRTARTTRGHNWHRLVRSRAASSSVIRAGRRPQSLACGDPFGAAGIDPVTRPGSDAMMPDMDRCGPTTSWQSGAAHPQARTTEANVTSPNAMAYTVRTPHSAGLIDVTPSAAMPYTVRTPHSARRPGTTAPDATPPHAMPYTVKPALSRHPRRPPQTGTPRRTAPPSEYRRRNDAPALSRSVIGGAMQQTLARAPAPPQIARHNRTRPQ